MKINENQWKSKVSVYKILQKSMILKDINRYIDLYAVLLLFYIVNCPELPDMYNYDATHSNVMEA